jgi:hypothetical protein
MRAFDKARLGAWADAVVREIEGSRWNSESDSKQTAPAKLNNLQGEHSSVTNLPSLLKTPYWPSKIQARYY